MAKTIDELALLAKELEQYGYTKEANQIKSVLIKKAKAQSPVIQIFDGLVKCANELDEKGYVVEADMVTTVIRRLAQSGPYNQAGEPLMSGEDWRREQKIDDESPSMDLEEDYRPSRDEIFAETLDDYEQTFWDEYAAKFPEEYEKLQDMGVVSGSLTDEVLKAISHGTLSRKENWVSIFNLMVERALSGQTLFPQEKESDSTPEDFGWNGDEKWLGE